MKMECNLSIYINYSCLPQFYTAWKPSKETIKKVKGNKGKERDKEKDKKKRKEKKSSHSLRTKNPQAIINAQYELTQSWACNAESGKESMLVDSGEKVKHFNYNNPGI